MINAFSQEVADPEAVFNAFDLINIERI
jgi:hypothetical protein